MTHKLTSDHLPTLSALSTALYADEHHLDTAAASRRPPPPRFVTISRQAGAGGRSFATCLVTRLNEIDTADLHWTLWDNELVERVATEYHLRPSAIASLEDQPHSWLEEALGNLAIGGTRDHPDEITLYHRVSTTIRALAEIGRVVIVGRGGGFITKDLPGGVHLRLVAPLEYRVNATANSMNIPPAAAREWVRQTDRAREAFYRRHWPKITLIPENFTATYNTAAVTTDRLVDSVLALISAASVQTPAPSTMTHNRTN